MKRMEGVANSSIKQRGARRLSVNENANEVHGNARPPVVMAKAELGWGCFTM